MSDKKKNNKTDKIGASSSKIKNIQNVDKASGVKKVSGVKAAKTEKATGVLTAQEREKIFKMVDSEAAKLFGEGKIPAKNKETVIEAVKMAINSGIIDDSDDESEESSKNK